MGNILVPLHNHSEHSFLDGLSKLDEMAENCKIQGQTACGISDHGEVSGHVDFEKACKKHGVSPVFGMEGYFVDSIQRVREEKDKVNSHYCVYAKTNKGLKNLWKLSSLAYMEGRYYKPLADWEMLKRDNLHEDLIFTDGCLLANTARYILGQYEDEEYDLKKMEPELRDEMGKEKAREWLLQWKELKGDDFYMELHSFQIINPSTDEQIQLNKDMSKVNQVKVELANELDIKLIAVNDSHYVKEEQWESHGYIWAMSTNSDQTEHGKAASWMMDDEEIRFWISKHGIKDSVIQEAIQNTQEIASKCEGVEIERRLRLPLITHSKEDDLKLFREHLMEGFERKVVNNPKLNEDDVQRYRERMEYEQGILEEKDFSGYFNLVADYCKWAKEKGDYGKPMLVGPGRGSGGGSLVGYLLDITELDPLHYDLIFERFLNPERKGFPDFDLDFPQSLRPQVFKYLQEKFGEDRVCSIGNFSTLQPRALLRDLGRAMKIEYGDIEKMSKVIDNVNDIDTANIEVGWDDILQAAGGELAGWAERYPVLFEEMGKIVGTIRQSGTHAAGILISDKSLLGEMPLRVKGTGENQQLVTQFEMFTVEELGFIKFDVLGIRHLDTLMTADKLIHGDHDPRRFYDIPLEEYLEPEKWELVSEGDTNGIFQLEANAMTTVGKEFKPRSESDVADLISVNRPGVVRSGMLGVYLKRRAGREEVTTPHPIVTEITKRTFGVIVYQEQVMEIFTKVAGYTLSEADGIRKIMGKMLYQDMLKEKPVFIKRCLNNPEFTKGCGAKDPFDIAETIWDQIESAGTYSFNASHATAYALIATWGTMLKYKYPREYLTSLMQTDPGRVNRYVREARVKEIPVLPPDINESGRYFTLTPEGVKYGLQDIRSVGETAVKEILKGQPYESMEDFLERTSGRGGKKKTVLENLISVGAFDKFGDRTKLLQEFYDSRGIKDQWSPDFSQTEVVIDTEMRLVGNYITFDPMEEYRKAIEKMSVTSPKELDEGPKGAILNVGGQISRVKEHQARNGLMAFLTINWQEEEYPVTVFADTYERFKPFIQVTKPVIARVQRLDQGVCLKEIVRLDLINRSAL